MNDSSIPLQNTVKEASSRAAEALGEILGCPVNIHFDDIRLLGLAEYQQFIRTEIDGSGTTIYIRFSGGLSGSAFFLVLGDNAQKILQILEENDPGLIEDPTGISSALIEIGNIVLNIYAGTVINHLGVHVVYETPQILIETEKFDKLALLEDTQAEKFQILTSRLAIAGKEVVIFILLALHQLR